MEENIPQHPIENRVNPPKISHKRVLFILLIITLLVLVLLSFYISQGKKEEKKVEVLPTPTSVPKEPLITPQVEYENPLDKDTQYVNPFSEYKNPFDAVQ